MTNQRQSRIYGHSRPVAGAKQSSSRACDFGWNLPKAEITIVAGRPYFIFDAGHSLKFVAGMMVRMALYQISIKKTDLWAPLYEDLVES